LANRLATNRKRHKSNLKEELNKHYTKLNKKINKLNKQQNENTQSISKETFYPRVHNMDKIQFTKQEQDLLNKGIS
jgi:hypothetical protein